MCKGLKQIMDGVLKRSPLTRGRSNNLIELADAKVRGNIPETRNVISTANLRGLSFCKDDNNRQGSK